jgi:ATP-binding cassette, subfamily B, bacterial
MNAPASAASNPASDAAGASAKAPRKLSALAGLLPFMRPYRVYLAVATVMLVFSSAAMLVVPIAFRDLIDKGFVRNATSGDINGHFLALFGAGAVPGRCSTALPLLLRVSWIGERVTADLRSAVYGHDAEAERRPSSRAHARARCCRG